MWIKTSRQYREITSQKILWGHWFAFFNILLSLLIASRYAFLIDWPNTLLGKLYFFISALGHFSFIVFAVYLLIVFPLSFLIKNERTFRGVSVIIATVCITLLALDTEVFARFNLHLSSIVWNLLVNPDNGELSRNWQLFFAPMPFILLIQMLFSRWAWYKWRSLERQTWGKYIGLFFVSTFVATHLIYVWADATIYRPITMQRSNFPLSYPMTARTFLEKHGLLDKEEYSQMLLQEGRADAPLINYPKKALRFSVTKDKPTIVFVTVTGLTPNAVSAERMPNLANVAANAWQFQHHYTSGTHKNGALVGLFYGLSGYYTDSVLSEKTPSVLLRQLMQSQYQIGLFSATGWRESIFKQALFVGQTFTTAKKNDNQSAVKNWEKWFDTPQPEHPQFSYVSLTLPSQQDSVQAEQQLDQLLGEMWERIKARSNTLFIVTAEYGKNNAAKIENDFSRAHIQVPLILYWDRLGINRVSRLTSHVDLLPTLLDRVFAVENPASDYSQGESLLKGERTFNWVLVSNYRHNVIVVPNGDKYQFDRKGDYQKLSEDDIPQSSARPPLGLFLEVFNHNRTFIAK